MQLELVPSALLPRGEYMVWYFPPKSLGSFCTENLKNKFCCLEGLNLRSFHIPRHVLLTITADRTVERDKLMSELDFFFVFRGKKGTFDMSDVNINR